MLSELIQEACKYGRINLYQSDSGNFNFSIEFRTDVGIELKAESHYKHKTPESAVVEALEKAVKIVSSFGYSNKNVNRTRELLCLFTTT